MRITDIGKEFEYDVIYKNTGDVDVTDIDILANKQDRHSGNYRNT